MSAPLATIGMWIVSLLATETALAPIDYAADADAWNGLGYLETTAAEARVQLRRVATLDLGRLVSGDVLLWVFPSAAVGAVGADDADAFAADISVGPFVEGVTSSVRRKKSALTETHGYERIQEYIGPSY